MERVQPVQLTKGSEQQLLTDLLAVVMSFGKIIEEYPDEDRLAKDLYRE